MERHPSEETLLAIASGNADTAQRVLAEVHLAFCGACREAVASLAAPGGALLAALPAETPRSGLWESISKQLATPPAGIAATVHTAADAAAAADSSVVRIPRLELPELPLPPGARAELELAGRAAARPKLRWRTVLQPGARWAAVYTNPHEAGYLVAARSDHANKFPAHEHVAQEDGVVLAGGYDDERGSFVAGDYVVYEAGSRHSPATDYDEGCIILARLEVPNRFLGWRGVVQRLVS